MDNTEEKIKTVDSEEKTTLKANVNKDNGTIYFIEE